VLEPKPPAWYRGGTRGFLEQVRLAGGEEERISILAVEPDRIARAFKNYAWVENVSKVTYPPGGLTVTLEYRQPVAAVRLPQGLQELVDQKGNWLRLEDVDVSRLGPLAPLIVISGEGLVAPADPRPGVIWMAEGRPGELPRPDGRVLAGAKLAGFLTKEPQVQEAARSPALHVLEIIVTESNREEEPAQPRSGRLPARTREPDVGAADWSSRRPVEPRGLFILNAEATMIQWGAPPGEEPPGEPTARVKWTMLRDWSKAQATRSLPKGDYWAFFHDELRPVQTNRSETP
jgi:hypothetical protein